MDESHTFPTYAARQRGSRIRFVVLGITAAFLLGVAASWALLGGRVRSPGFFSSWQKERTKTPPPVANAPSAAPAQSANPPAPLTRAPPVAAVAEEARQTAQKVAQVAQQTGGINQRMAAMEQRISQLEQQAQAAAGNAARAEGLLITFAARRAIERGVPLGYVAQQLRLRFGHARPNAVQTVIDEARNPVTLDQLLTRLENLAPRIMAPPRSASLLTRIGDQLSQLLVIRRDSTPSPLPQRRMERVRLYLETGRVNNAVAEVRNMPNAAAAAGWIKDAERYAAAQRALDVLEKAAIMEPPHQQQTSGRVNQQPAPVAGSARPGQP